MSAWLINAGWSDGACDTGEHIKLKHIRAIVDTIRMEYWYS